MARGVARMARSRRASAGMTLPRRSRRGMTPPRRLRRGMTLVELLAAMAIFLGLAGMILQVLGGGLDLWSTGERTRDESEQASVLLDRLSSELRHAVASDGGDGEPRVRMLCDFVLLDADGDGTRDFRAQRLLFCRWHFEERRAPVLASADGAPPPLKENLTEVAFVLQPDVRPGYEGRAVLWRALKSPPGGPGGPGGPGRNASLFALALKDEGGLDGAALEPLAENVLWLGFSFVDDSVQDVALAPGAGGPLVLWDSTRALLPAGEGYDGFRHARGQASLADPDDDVFPQAVRVAVVLTAPPGELPTPELVTEIPGGSGPARAEIRNGTWLRRQGAGARTLKIGHEWVEIAETDGTSIVVVRRGLLGTAPTAHPPGSKILVGRRFERLVPLPAARFDLIPRDIDRRRP